MFNLYVITPEDLLLHQPITSNNHGFSFSSHVAFCFKIRAQLSKTNKSAFHFSKSGLDYDLRSLELANILASIIKLCNVRRTGPRSCHVICFSTDLYIICGLLLLYTINIVWYSDLVSQA